MSDRRRLVRAFSRLLALLPLAVPLCVPVGQAAAQSAAGEPTVAQLLKVCARGRAAGDVGVDAALCEWYAVPCDCAAKRADAPQRWCMPEDEPIGMALPKVLAALRKEPRQSAPAAAVVPEVMARLYPCTAAPAP